jgi:uncharacterized protein
MLSPSETNTTARTPSRIVEIWRHSEEELERGVAELQTEEQLKAKGLDLFTRLKRTEHEYEEAIEEKDRELAYAIDFAVKHEGRKQIALGQEKAAEHAAAVERLESQHASVMDAKGAEQEVLLEQQQSRHTEELHAAVADAVALKQAVEEAVQAKEEAHEQAVQAAEAAAINLAAEHAANVEQMNNDHASAITAALAKQEAQHLALLDMMDSVSGQTRHAGRGTRVTEIDTEAEVLEANRQTIPEMSNSREHLARLIGIDSGRIDIDVGTASVCTAVAAGAAVAVVASLLLWRRMR